MPDVKADTVLSVTALTISAFGFFMPTVREVRESERTPKIEDELQNGALLAGGLIVGVAIVASSLSGNWNRLFVSVAAVAIFVSIYVYQLGDNDGIPSLQGVYRTITGN